MDFNTKLVNDVCRIKENKLCTWKEVARDIGISQMQLIRIKNGPQPPSLNIMTKRKLRDYITKNQEYI